MEALSGIKTEIVGPYLEFYEQLPGQGPAATPKCCDKKMRRIGCNYKIKRS